MQLYISSPGTFKPMWTSLAGDHCWDNEQCCHAPVMLRWTPAWSQPRRYLQKISSAAGNMPQTGQREHSQQRSPSPLVSALPLTDPGYQQSCFLSTSNLCALEVRYWHTGIPSSAWSWLHVGQKGQLLNPQMLTTWFAVTTAMAMAPHCSSGHTDVNIWHGFWGPCW